MSRPSLLARLFSTVSIITLLISLPTLSSASTAASVSSPYLYNFNSSGILGEAGSMNESTSPYWWVNSGGLMPIANGVGETIQGNLSALSPWHILYAANNPLDTDNGDHPQNIFRLVSRNTWQNYTEQAYFEIMRDNLSSSPNRNASNGLLLFNRYQNGDSLYYAGIRVDGAAVIKKKINGIYYTMAYKQIFPGTYDRTAHPNLIPKNTWIGLRTVVANNSNGTATIKLYTDVGKTGTWTLVLQSEDDGVSFGRTAPITHSGFVGIRTDFMDVLFDDFRVASL